MLQQDIPFQDHQLLNLSFRFSIYPQKPPFILLLVKTWRVHMYMCLIELLKI